MKQSLTDIDFDIIKTLEFFKKEEDGEWEYDLTGTDNNGNEYYLDWPLNEEELIDFVGEEIAEIIITAKSNMGYVQDIIDTTPTDPNDVDEVNKIAKRIWVTTEYYPGLHGYILTDGTCLDFGAEGLDHRNIGYIDGVDMWKFIELGNIRCAPSSFELMKEPTLIQERILKTLIRNAKEEVFVDISSNKGRYQNICNGAFGPDDYQYAINVINRYFNEGIKF